MVKKLILIFMAIIIMMGWVNTFGQTYNNEVLTMFTRGTVNFPPGKTTAKIGEIGFNPSAIKNVIIKYGGQTMTIAFPNYRRQDSIFVSLKDPNLKVKQMELDLIYKIYLSDASKRDSLNLQLKQFAQVLFSQNNGTEVPLVNDPRYNDQWGLNQSSNYDIDAPECWDLETGNSDMSIGILD